MFVLKLSGIQSWIIAEILAFFFLAHSFMNKFSMDTNIVKMQIFHKIKYDLKGHSRSQITTFLFKNLLFLLFVLLID